MRHKSDVQKRHKSMRELYNIKANMRKRGLELIQQELDESSERIKKSGDKEEI